MCMDDLRDLIIGNDLFIRKNGKLFTKTVTGGKPRFWNPTHSKLSALLLKKKDLSLPQIRTILYLGGGHGTTVSHLSYLLPSGTIYVVEFGITMEEVLSLTDTRKNIFPIMEDASIPGSYRGLITKGSVDLLYQDIAQRDQMGILHMNLEFLRKEGHFIFMVKTRSIAQDEVPSQIAGTIMEKLSQEPDIQNIRMVGLEPYQKEHYAIIGRKN